MTQPTLNQPQIPQRLHTDPPALWKTVILSSVAIHLVGLGLLRLALLGRFQNWHLSQRLIPVEMIVIASNATMPTPATQSPPSSVSQKTPAQSPESQPESAPQTNRPTQAIANTIQKTPKPSSTTLSSPNSSNPTPNPSPTSTTSEGMGETPSPEPSKEPPNPTTPSPSPIPSPEEPTEPTSPDNQSGGGFIASINGFKIVSSNGSSNIDPQRNPGDQFAKLQKQSQFISVDKLRSLDITLEQPVVVKVIILITDMGKAEVISAETLVQPGTLSPEQATKLANQIIADWRFSPTYMAYSPVYGSYSLTLEIDPLGN
ncbi:MAG: hypothetical protein RIG63_17385 [Coleofasciculus chthonoplastes F3-SA18-01]|uniref:hypothetical protein n=1 Tax=Coleofasciculus chthonoplastes TaxID=64178 RepID=UPI0032F0AACD